MVRDQRRLRGTQKGEEGHKSGRAKVAREEKEQLKEEEMKVDVDSPQGESAETKSSKRNMIRAESEETQDYVCGTVAVSQEEGEELAFVPSALSEPRGSIYFCDNRCSEKAVRYWQFASVVGEEAHTVNLCQHCYNERTVGTARQAEVEFVAIESSRGKESTSWENVENCWK